MPSDQPTGPRDLDWLLQGLVERVPRTRSAILLSSDGLAKASHGLEADHCDSLAAVTSGLYALARGAAGRLGDSGGVRQIMVELTDTVLFVSTAGDGARLAVLADREADAAVLGHEAAQLARSVRHHLATPARQPSQNLRGAGCGFSAPPAAEPA
ncbi:roadblock/LC7 domain-containing protein [Streptomyces sp. S1A]|uniref:roadblock/LC7 domain-containing protein n=1 Tax=Streptomyces sp. ICN903 TaxID=2964654 RepID=UPI001EDAF0D8|nr:roadblock/LC7 domain-containing protein [Streptomyces sp. ICN903]MCG3038995.1 roadblock/LC7 domain-containing protein [Streptomyces sp. ICN903]